MNSDDYTEVNKTNESIAVIPARGQSKGIIKKNLQLLLGKPLIAHTIESAQNAGWVDRVIVSTDDIEIAHISECYGAKVVMRPSNISGDTTPSEAALLHVIDYLKTKENIIPRILTFLQCTSPLTLPQDIDGTIQALLDHNADSALAVTPFHYFLWKRDNNGNAKGINHEKETRLMRQQRSGQFLEAGAVYAMMVEGFLIHQHRFFGKTVLYEMPPERCYEIDEYIDLRIVETLMREDQKKKQITALPEIIEAIVFDFDGVFTDNRVFILEDGKEAVSCNRSDGMGLSQLKKRNLPILVLSSEKNNVVRTRCNKLGIECIQGIEDKLIILKKWLDKYSIDIKNVVYVGNDTNDLSCIIAVGCGVAVRDAHPDVTMAADFVLSASGGDGAVRELTELIIQKMEEA